jgi:20S proteasome alpha/beta subunit
MAADSMMHDDHVRNSVAKIFRMKDGSLMGVAGTIADAVEFVNFMEGKRPSPPDDMSEVHIVHLTHHGVFLYQCSSTPVEIIDPFAAAGSGASAALGAMHFGATPQEAVEIAIKVDPFTAGPVLVMDLETPKNRRRRIPDTPEN